MRQEPADSVWRLRAADLLKTELFKARVTYKELVERLQEHGIRESVGSISQKLLRGSFSASFMLAVLDMLKADTLRVLSESTADRSAAAIEDEQSMSHRPEA